MLTPSVFQIFVIIFSTWMSYSYCDTYKRNLTEEEACLQAITARNRVKQARPVRHWHQAIKINITFHVIQLIEVDDRRQTISVAGFLDLRWFDDSVRWNAADYNGLTEVTSSSNELWIPDIGNGNSISGELVLKAEEDNPEPLQVYSNGIVRWTPGNTFRVSCPLDMTYFPFDVQSCLFVFESWFHPANKLTIIAPKDTMVTNNVKSNSEWVITRTSAHVINYLAVDSQYIWSQYQGTVHISRKSMYFVLNILVPLIALSFLVLMVFHLPPEAGEKISLSTTVLVAFTVFQLVVADIMPQSSDSTPILVIYVSALMVMAITSTIFSVVIIHIHNVHENQAPPSRFLRRIIYKLIAPITCARSIARHKPSLPSRLELKDHPGEHGDKNSLSPRDQRVELGNGQATTDVIEHRDKIYQEWRLIARIVDRFLMLLYLLINVTLVIVCFTLLLSGYHKHKVSETTP
ncbi:neuronal acetylcholine receptor subunit non-alpha-2-like [Tubulanus polymorphus]|uniref:neuronal acetylcholine receptor subunit non-alpha-2-like n=1 Tax=Tubulanus polymorphus TaxID=672921 RepID=UPI003DA5D683